MQAGKAREGAGQSATARAAPLAMHALAGFPQSVVYPQLARSAPLRVGGLGGPVLFEPRSVRGQRGLGAQGADRQQNRVEGSGVGAGVARSVVRQYAAGGQAAGELARCAGPIDELLILGRDNLPILLRVAITDEIIPLGEDFVSRPDCMGNVNCASSNTSLGLAAARQPHRRRRLSRCAGQIRRFGASVTQPGNLVGQTRFVLDNLIRHGYRLAGNIGSALTKSRDSKSATALGAIEYDSRRSSCLVHRLQIITAKFSLARSDARYVRRTLSLLTGTSIRLGFPCGRVASQRR